MEESKWLAQELLWLGLIAMVANKIQSFYIDEILHLLVYRQIVWILFSV